ncbi:MAG TPA: HDOD domain-containing protein [Phycisphaerae bacterium]|nr:HDOD domain-containing protein [Phycisphaerae bacterium]
MIAAPTQDKAAQFVASVIADVGEIATLPEVTVKIIQVVENPKATARELHEIIRVDPALSARILKVVNSAFYGLPGQISNMDRAIVLLGLSAVKNIAIAASMTQMFNSGTQVEGFNGNDVWKHSVSVAVGCRLLTAAQGRPAVEESFLAGLIHDMGLLVERQMFAKQLGEVIKKAGEGQASFCELEQQIIGADHQAFGMALATKWRFPSVLCTAIGYHHKPMQVAQANRELSVLVHLADVLAARASLGFTATAVNDSYDDEMLAVVNLSQGDLDEVSAKLPEQVAIAESIFSV